MSSDSHDDHHLDHSHEHVGDFTSHGFVFAIFLAIESVAGLLVAYDLRHRQELNAVLRTLLCLSIALTWATTSSFLVWSILETIEVELSNDRSLTIETLMNAINWSLFQLNFICIVTTLIWRTHITFAGTVYELSRRYKLAFGSILCILVAISCVNLHILCTLDSLEGAEWKMWFTILLALSGLWFLLYTLSAVISVFLFQSHLVSLVRKQSNCTCDVTSSSEHLQLTERQRSMVALASKYIWLFVIASFSSIAVMASIFEQIGLIAHCNVCLLTSVYVIADQIINVLCLYLQFGFTEKLYRKLCRWPDVICQRCIEWRLQKWQRAQRNRIDSNSPKSLSSAGRSAHPVQLDVVASDSEGAV